MHHTPTTVKVLHRLETSFLSVSLESLASQLRLDAENVRDALNWLEKIDIVGRNDLGYFLTERGLRVKGIKNGEISLE